jgi:hypothetical protein
MVEWLRLDYMFAFGLRLSDLLRPLQFSLARVVSCKPPKLVGVREKAVEKAMKDPCKPKRPSSILLAAGQMNQSTAR